MAPGPVPGGLGQAQQQAAESSTPIAPSSNETSFVVGTRKSALALIQTHLVATSLSHLHPDCSFPVESTSTLGDRNQTTPLHLLSPYSSTQPAKSLWTDELEALLAAGSFDLLVHSLKDVPTSLPEGFELAACAQREDPRDALVVREGLEYQRLEDLEIGSVVGTGSVRRVAQLKRAFPGLRFEDMRGNLNTRLSKLDSPTSQFSALILATSGLTRLGQGHRITCPLSSPTLLHAVGQGALAMEIRAGDERVRNIMRGIGHWQTEWAVGAERGLLRVLEGGCSVPVGVETILTPIPSGSSSFELDGENGSAESEPLDEAGLPPLTGTSPMIHFSGILPPSAPLPAPTATASQVAPLLQSQRARLKLLASVTSVDGSKHVLYDAPEVIVASWRGAEKWGEECARRLKDMGAGEVLDEINRSRREREAADIKKAEGNSLQETQQV